MRRSFINRNRTKFKQGALPPVESVYTYDLCSGIQYQDVANDDKIYIETDRPYKFVGAIVNIPAWTSIGDLRAELWRAGNFIQNLSPLINLAQAPVAEDYEVFSNTDVTLQSGDAIRVYWTSGNLNRLFKSSFPVNVSPPNPNTYPYAWQYVGQVSAFIKQLKLLS